MIPRVLILVLAFVLEASAQTFPTPGPGHVPWTATAGGGAVLFNAPTQNIHDTYDPKCNPATAAATGIIFCDGFEDGKIGEAGDTLGAATDYWSLANPDGAPRNCSTGSCNDATGKKFTECNASPSNLSKADFGAAGTPCTGTMGWNRVVALQHCLRAFGGNPGACATNHTTGQTDVQNLRVRFMVRYAGASSTRCPGGFGTCPAFNFVDGTEGGNTNGTKGVEMGDGLDQIGISYLNFATQNEPSGSFKFGGLDHVDSPDGSNAAKTCANQGGDYCAQHLNGSSFSMYDPTVADHWLFVEWHIVQSNTDDGSSIELWYGSCGLNGKCTGSPIQKIGATGWDIFLGLAPPVDPTFSLPDSLWFNWWTPGGILGEIQIDEIVVADGAIMTSPIGFPTNLN